MICDIQHFLDLKVKSKVSSVSDLVQGVVATSLIQHEYESEAIKL